MWCVKFTFETILTEISQNVRFPHFPLFQIFAHIRCISIHIGYISIYQVCFDTYYISGIFQYVRFVSIYIRCTPIYIRHILGIFQHTSGMPLWGTYQTFVHIKDISCEKCSLSHCELHCELYVGSKYGNWSATKSTDLTFSVVFENSS